MDLGEPIALPYMAIPEPLNLQVPILEVPDAQVPSYKPMVVPPSALRAPPGIKGKPLDGKQPNTQPNNPTTPPKAPEVDYVTVPIIDKEVPIPSQEILVTAVSTATVSVAATLTATAVFKHLVSIAKPLIKTAWTKITKKKDLSNSSSSAGQQDS
tara:strand:+ start:336 stop:800 length:465 start_codon:yes stop_codon:yes gene_type:complete